MTEEKRFTHESLQDAKTIAQVPAIPYPGI